MVRVFYLKKLIGAYLAAGLVYIIFINVFPSEDKVMAIMISAMPFGMHLFKYIVPFNLFGDSDSARAFWFIKIMASVIMGIIALPIATIYYIIRIIIGR